MEMTHGHDRNQSHHLIDEINVGNYTPVLYLRIAAIPPKAIIS